MKSITYRNSSFIKNIFAYSLALTIIVVAFFVVTLLTGKIAEAKTTLLQLTNNNLITHAMGRIDGASYTNSLEAFIENYKKGYRYFEVDLIFTSDNKLVAKHDWDSNNGTALSYNEYMNSKINEKYTPLDFEDIVILMQTYKDVYIITDTKETDQANTTKAFQYIYDTANSTDSSILDRIIPQTYSQDMYGWITDIYNFKDIIYTLYQSNDSDDQVIDFISKNGITKVTMSTSRFSAEFVDRLNQIHVSSFVHTINSTDDAETYISQGVYGFYTDDLNITANKTISFKEKGLNNLKLSDCLLFSNYCKNNI